MKFHVYSVLIVSCSLNALSCAIQPSKKAVPTLEDITDSSGTTTCAPRVINPTDLDELQAAVKTAITVASIERSHFKKRF